MTQSNAKTLAARPAADAARATVLLVDDHPPNLIAFEAALAPLGVRLVRATSGAEAVKIASREDFALVVLDLRMPDLDGYETAARLKLAAKSRPLPIIIVTAASPSQPDVLRGYESGAVDFLAKPIDPDVLRTKASVFVDLYEERILASREERAADSGRQLVDRLGSLAGHAALVDALGRLQAALGGSLDAATIASRFANEVVELTQARGAAVRYAREGKDVVALAGALRHELATLDPSEELFVPIQEGRAILAGDAHLETAPRVRSVVAVPIKARTGDVAGALVLVHDESDAFDLRDEDIASVAAHHARTSLDVALLYEEANEARHRAELAELDSRATAARLRLALDSTDLGTWEVAPDTARVRCDETCSALLRLGGGDLPLSEFLTAIDDRDRERIARALALAFASCGGETAFDEAFRTRASDGSVRWIAARGRALGDGGRCSRFIGTVRDVTEQKRRAEERADLLERERAARTDAEAARERAETAGRVKEEFLATVSHELRTPLNAILGWSQLLLENDISDERTRNGLAIIAKNARAQVRVVEDVLDVSSIVSGKLRLDVDVVDMRRALHLATESIQPTALAKDVEIETSCTDDVEVIADPNRIQQVLWNLLANAVKFTPRGGHIDARVARDGETVVVTVSDTGIGIDRAFLPHVFERFRQADGGTARRYGGLGLGLAIVRHIVELQGGEVDVQSEGLGRGTNFTVRLPAMSEARLPPRRPRRSTFPPPRPLAAVDGTMLAGVHALVVEDDDTLRDLVAVILSDAGATVTPAANVTEAIRALEREHPDVIVSDIGIAHEDGLALVRRIRGSKQSRLSRLPMLALTAHARPEDAERILRAGFDRHVAKPVAPGDLVMVVGELVGRSS